jgi:hypothetical protein
MTLDELAGLTLDEMAGGTTLGEVLRQLNETLTLAAIANQVRTELSVELARIDAAISSRGTSTFSPASDEVILTSDARNAAADALLERAGAVDGKTVRQTLRIIAAMLAGKVSGAGSGTERFKGLDGATTRVEVATDTAGNRLSVTYDPV